MSPRNKKFSSILTQAVLASTLLTMSHAGHAVVTVSTSVTGPFAISTDGKNDDIQIAASGKISSNGANNGFEADVDNKSLTIDDNNTGPNAILVDTGRAIDIQNDAITVSVGENSGVLATGDNGVGIYVGAPNASITNSGTIEVQGSTADTTVIKVDNTAATITNTGTGQLLTSQPAATVLNFQQNFVSLTNDAGGTIKSAGDANQGAAIFVGAVTGDINNSGTIDGNKNDAINLQGMQGTLTNTATGQIISQEDTITVNTADATGKIVNAGTIETTGQVDNGNVGAIRISKNLAGGVTNTGTIKATSDGATKTVGALVIDDVVTTAINNDAGGTIQGIKGTVGDGAYGLYINNALTGTVTNAGTITTDNQHAVLIDTANGGITGAITNTGTISVTDASSDQAAIKVADAANTITGGINNNGGTISVAKADGVVIDLSAATTDILLKNSGTLTGNVLLSGTTGNNPVFEMTAGTLTGTLTASNVNQNTLTITGGTVTGAIQLGDNGDTLNLGSATLSNPLTGGAGADTLNVIDSFSSTQAISKIETIHVQNAGTTFDVGGAITDVDTDLKIDADTILTANADISGKGATTNIGTLNVSAGQTFEMTGAFNNTGTINNAGLIKSTTVDLQAGGKGNIINSGTIDGIDNAALSLSGPFTGDITNQAGGVLTSTTNAGPTVDLAEALTGTFTNAGTIAATGPAGLFPTIQATNANANISKGLINTGTVTVANNAHPAIDLSQSMQSIKLTNSGTITGDVVLSDGGGDVFAMTGGTLTGKLNATGAGSTLSITGGTVTGDITLTGNNDIVNVGSATLQGELIGNGGADTLNVIDDFTATAAIKNIQTIHVQNPDVDFIVNAPITGLDTQLTIDNAAFLDAQADIKGTADVTNQGTFAVRSGRTVTLAGDFDNAAGGFVGLEAGGTLNVNNYNHDPASMGLTVQLSSPTQLGQIIANNTFNLDNSKVTIALAGNEIITDGDVFTIIDAANAGGSITGTQFIQPDSFLLNFTSMLQGNDLVLIANRQPFSELPSNPLTNDLVRLLDEVFPASGALEDIYIYLDSLTAADELQQALTSFLPIQGLQIQQGLSDQLHRHQHHILRHIEHMERVEVEMTTDSTFQGINSGDSFSGPKGLWSYVYFNTERQKDKSLTNGYDGDGMGFGLGWDVTVFDQQTVIGGAISWSRTDYEMHGPNANKQDQKALTFALYGDHHFDEYPAYLEMIGSVTYNEYQNTRNTPLGTNQGTFHAYYYDLFARFNYDYALDAYKLTPYATLEAAHLSTEDYTETGPTALVVHYDNVSLFAPGLGARLWWENEYKGATYTPELYFQFQYDLLNENIVSNSHFTNISTRAFTSGTDEPTQFSYHLGLKVSAYNHDRWHLGFGYDFAGRSGYQGHTAYLKLRYDW